MVRIKPRRSVQIILDLYRRQSTPTLTAHYPFNMTLSVSRFCWHECTVVSVFFVDLPFPLILVLVSRSFSRSHAWSLAHSLVLVLYCSCTLLVAPSLLDFCSRSRHLCSVLVLAFAILLGSRSRSRHLSRGHLRSFVRGFVVAGASIEFDTTS